MKHFPEQFPRVRRSGFGLPAGQRKIPNIKPRPKEDSDFVRLEVRTEVLHTLVKSKALFVEDVRGLDTGAKNRIKQWLLENLHRSF